MPRVLLVEDEAPILMLLADALGDEGHTVADALTCAEAEAALLEQHRELDVLVTDVNVQTRGWGFGFAARARALNPALRVVYITGHAEGEVRRQGVPGAVTLPKPFLPSDLVAAVERLVRCT